MRSCMKLILKSSRRKTRWEEQERGDYDLDKFKAEFGVSKVIRIGKCRQNDSLAWTTIPRCSFQDFGMELIEGSTEDDWL